MRNWTDKRVTLVGDAVHPVLQYLAQGAGQAIKDAVVLREALRFYRGDIPAVFQKYQEARYLRTGRVQLTARFYGDLPCWRSPARAAQSDISKRCGERRVYGAEVDVRRDRSFKAVSIKSPT